MRILQSILKYDPIPQLLSSSDIALIHFVRKCLLDQDVDIPSFTLKLPFVQKLIGKQQSDGSWTCHPSRIKAHATNYKLVETWKALRLLIDKYALHKDYQVIQKAAEYVFACQSVEGDIRGFLANQYATYYTGALMGLLIKAGYSDDARIEKGFHWLLSMRQNDGGWSIPLITHMLSMSEKDRLTREFVDPVLPDRTKPFSHTANGMVLRAFAAHPSYRKSDAAKIASSLQKARFFLKDSCTSYQSADYWIQFQFPFWWNNLVSSMDSISLIDEAIDEPIERAVRWLADHQGRDGLWKVAYTGKAKEETLKVKEMCLWVTFAICRILRRYYRE